MVMPPVHLGYIQDSGSPHRTQVPSKVGGKPAWLIGRPLPSPEELKCRKCSGSLIFLCQIYAPRGQAFHRMLYVFACWICGEDAALFRCQLPQHNDWLPPELSDSAPQCFAQVDLDIEKQACVHCLLPTDEKSGMHQRCINAEKHQTVLSHLPSYILGIEEEYELSEQSTALDEKILARAREAPIIKEVDGEEDEEVEDEAALEDAVLDNYINYMSNHPAHVIRYGDMMPLWFCSKGQLSEAEVPNCELCGAARRFELQVQSSLLDSLGVGPNLELAFGILALYTCTGDCEPETPRYVREFIYKQKDPTLNEKKFRQF